MSVKKENGTEIGIGKVVEAGRHEYRMSDYSEFGVYAILLKDDGTYERVVGCDFSATVDATPEMIETYKAHMAAIAEASRREWAARNAAIEAEKARKEAEKAAKMEERRIKNLAAEKGIEVVKGSMVKVVKGASKGSVGKAFWIGNGSLGTKLGVALDDQKDARGRYVNVAWVLKKNVEVVAA